MKLSRRHFLVLMPAAAIAWKSVLAGTPEQAENYKLSAKVKVTVLGHEETHTLTFASLPGQFSVTSDFADSMIEAAEMAAEQVTLQSQLTKVLA